MRFPEPEALADFCSEARLARIIHNPMRKRGISFKSLAYASGYDKQSALQSVRE